MQNQLKPLSGDPLPWLLEPDPNNPGIRYFAWRDLLDRPEDNPEVRQARADIMKMGPVPVILEAQHPDGYWVNPGVATGPVTGPPAGKSFSWPSWERIRATSECNEAVSTS